MSAGLPMRAISCVAPSWTVTGNCCCSPSPMVGVPTLALPSEVPTARPVKGPSRFCTVYCRRPAHSAARTRSCPGSVTPRPRAPTRSPCTARPQPLTCAGPRSRSPRRLPSGRFMANAAWLALAVMAHNLARAVGALAGMGHARTATLRQRIFVVPGRLVHTARRLHLRLPPQLALGRRLRHRRHPHRRPRRPRLTTPSPPRTRRSRQTGSTRTPKTRNCRSRQPQDHHQLRITAGRWIRA